MKDYTAILHFRYLVVFSIYCMLDYKSTIDLPYISLLFYLIMCAVQMNIIILHLSAVVAVIIVVVYGLLYVEKIQATVAV